MNKYKKILTLYLPIYYHLYDISRVPDSLPKYILSNIIRLSHSFQNDEHTVEKTFTLNPHI